MRVDGDRSEQRQFIATMNRIDPSEQEVSKKLIKEESKERINHGRFAQMCGH